MSGRTETTWRKTILDGKEILWIDGSEGTGARVCSVLDPERTAPAERRLSDGSAVTLEGEPRGLIVYGSCKWDRPTLNEFCSDAEYGYLAVGIREGRGVTT